MDASGCADLLWSSLGFDRLEDVDGKSVKKLVGDDEGRAVCLSGYEADVLAPDDVQVGGVLACTPVTNIDLFQRVVATEKLVLSLT